MLQRSSLAFILILCFLPWLTCQPGLERSRPGGSHSVTREEAEAPAEIAIPAALCRILNSGDLDGAASERQLWDLHLQLPRSRYSTDASILEKIRSFIRRLGWQSFQSARPWVYGVNDVWTGQQEYTAYLDLLNLADDAVPYLVGAAESRVEPLSDNACALLLERVFVNWCTQDDWYIQRARRFRETDPRARRGWVACDAERSYAAWERVRRIRVDDYYKKWLILRASQRSLSFAITLQDLAGQHDGRAWFEFGAASHKLCLSAAFGDQFAFLVNGKRVGTLVCLGMGLSSQFGLSVVKADWRASWVLGKDPDGSDGHYEWNPVPMQGIAILDLNSRYGLHRQVAEVAPPLNH